MKNSKLIEIFGWYGAGAIITAYALLSYEILSPHSIAYQLLNLSGAIGVLVDSWKQRNYQPVVINIFWAVIAIIALLRLV